MESNDTMTEAFSTINEVPEKILKKIKGGWIAAIITGSVTIIFMMIAIITGAMGNLFSLWTLIDVVLVFALAFGIFKKSRTASTIMFVYFVWCKIWLVSQMETPPSPIMSLVFLYFYLQAMIGTYQYHKIKKTPNQELQPTVKTPVESGNVQGTAAEL